MKILCVGKICLDIVNYLDSYPDEDTDQSIPLQRWSQGGNAANNCVVFNQLKSIFCLEERNEFECELLGTFGTDLGSAYIRNLLRDNGVVADRCTVKDNCGGGLISTSCVVVNRSNGSRTIVHARNDVPDIDFQDFALANIDFGNYDWINFETRRVEETRKMLDLVLSWRQKSLSSKPLISVEIEKDKENCDSLFLADVDYLFVGKDLANSRNFKTMRETVDYVSKFVDSPKKTTIVCPWGDKGACVLETQTGRFFSCEAYQPSKAIDTLGAGDTFFSSFIFARGQLGKSCSQALKFACLAAGIKCGIVGYDDLGQRLKNLLDREGMERLFL